LSTRGRLPILLCWGAAFCLLILSGLSCAIYTDGPISGHAWLTTESEPRSFITPQCLSVKGSLQRILGDPPYQMTTDGFDAIRDWVARSIEYMPDEDRVGKADAWQTPAATLMNPRVGDCEDFSLLLCSLLRCYGIGAERVFVAIGVDSRDNAHAFLIENWYLDGEWRRIEPQATAQLRRGFPLFRSVDAELDKYEIVAAFNDVYYYEQEFPWSEEKEASSSLRGIANAAGSIARHVSQLVGYLLGLLSSNAHDELITTDSALTWHVCSR
jgi:hypothetical protein